MRWMCKPVLLREIVDDERRNVDAGRLEVHADTMLVDSLLRGDSVVADHGVGERQQLSRVRGVCVEVDGRVWSARMQQTSEGLGVSNHARLEDCLARDRDLCAKRKAVKLSAVLEDETRTSAVACVHRKCHGHAGGVRWGASGELGSLTFTWTAWMKKTCQHSARCS